MVTQQVATLSNVRPKVVRKVLGNFWKLMADDLKSKSRVVVANKLALSLDDDVKVNGEATLRFIHDLDQGNCCKLMKCKTLVRIGQVKMMMSSKVPMTPPIGA